MVSIIKMEIKLIKVFLFTNFVELQSLIKYVKESRGKKGLCITSCHRNEDYLLGNNQHINYASLIYVLNFCNAIFAHSTSKLHVHSSKFYANDQQICRHCLQCLQQIVGLSFDKLKANMRRWRLHLLICYSYFKDMDNTYLNMHCS